MKLFSIGSQLNTPVDVGTIEFPITDLSTSKDMSNDNLEITQVALDSRSSASNTTFQTDVDVLTDSRSDFAEDELQISSLTENATFFNNEHVSDDSALDVGEDDFLLRSLMGNDPN